MSTISALRTIVDLITSIPLNPTSTVCAIALLVVGAMTWRIILGRDPPVRARRRRAAHRRVRGDGHAAGKLPIP